MSDDARMTAEERRSTIAFAIIVGVPLSFWGLTAAASYLESHGGHDFAALVTAWATIVIAIATAAYVAFTYRLWRSAAEQVRVSERSARNQVRASRRIAEAEFMQSLMAEYDRMRQDVMDLIRFYKERHVFVPGDFAAQIVSQAQS